jgi:hypothetical protein
VVLPQPPIPPLRQSHPQRPPRLAVWSAPSSVLNRGPQIGRARRLTIRNWIVDMGDLPGGKCFSFIGGKRVGFMEQRSGEIVFID